MVLNVDVRQFSRLLAGRDVTDGLIERLEELPDHVPVELHAKSKQSPKQVENRRFKDIEKRLSDIPKPKKFDRRRSNMTPDELKRIGEILYGENWITLLAQQIGYSEWHIESFMKGGDPTRFINEPTANYLRQADQFIRASGGRFTGAALSKPR